MPLVYLVPMVAVWCHWAICRLLQHTYGLFDRWYLGPFNCPVEDVVHVMMTLVSGSAPAT